MSGGILTVIVGLSFLLVSIDGCTRTTTGAAVTASQTAVTAVPQNAMTTTPSIKISTAASNLAACNNLCSLSQTATLDGANTVNSLNDIIRVDNLAVDQFMSCNGEGVPTGQAATFTCINTLTSSDRLIIQIGGMVGRIESNQPNERLPVICMDNGWTYEGKLIEAVGCQ